MMKKIRIGCGAGFSGDRLEPAVLLAEKGELDYLVLECLAERTIALAQKRKLKDPSKGYDPFLERRIALLLPHLVSNKITLITNMGAANPLKAAEKIKELAIAQNIKINIAAITGDEVFSFTSGQAFDFNRYTPFGDDKAIIYNPDTPVLNEQVISANAYMGVGGIIQALKAEAQIIITGRVADPSLFLAPMIHAFGWEETDFERLGQGTVVGHLLECAGQLTGGYFADPVKKPVPGMDQLGHPFADVFEDGTALLGKVTGTGGLINLQTTKEQLLYEVVNPYEYITPDVVANFTTVRIKETGPDTVEVSGGSGKPPLQTLKVSVGYQAGYLGEGEILYAGPSALERAALAAEIIKKRLSAAFPSLSVDYIGFNAASHKDITGEHKRPMEIRMRVTAKASTAVEAERIGEEVEALYTNGPAGGGGVRKYVHEMIGIVSVLANRTEITPTITLFKS